MARCFTTVKTDVDVIDTAALRDHLGPRGPWAKDAATRIAELLEDLRPAIEALGFKRPEQWLAAETSVTETTIQGVLRGDLVPRDYLRAAIAWRLGKDVADIWPPMRRAAAGNFLDHVGGR